MSVAEVSAGREHLPEILDVLVVGGGPGGTATAFRAKELGLSVLVIDYDDILKRIRDYSKDKLILPSFGGGDRMKFPGGGALVSVLRFGPIDKDEMCARWKGLYRDHDVPVRVGIELTGLESVGDGAWTVRTWDHGERCDLGFRARHVVLAVGRGVPRRFDIPGNTEGICYRLADATRYVGSPACVIGGGTSAAEAVIGISNAKTAADDPTSVCWSYRGDRMPRVSKALAERFFEAFVGNGNIRYYRRSEPTLVTTAEDRREYLAIRVDRRSAEGRPTQSTHLEFVKEQVIACIGEDLPEELLAAAGVRLVVGGPKSKKRMVVTRHLESEQPNVYLVGDLLSQAYFETDDFGSDPGTFREIKHRGNVKSALRDGVLVAEVIKQRLEGRPSSEIVIRIGDADEPAAGPAAPIALGSVDGTGPPSESVESSREIDEAEAFLVRILPGGVEEDEFPVPLDTVTTIGRGRCDISFPSDTSMSDSHASISHSEDGYFLRDDGSATGVFLRLPVARKTEVVDGDLIRVGRQFLVLSVADTAAAVIHYDADGREVARYDLGSKPLVLGRQAPVVLDAEDRTLSRRQLAIALERGRAFAKDLKSANGSYLRVRSAVRLDHASEIRVGQQAFAFSLRPDAVLDTGHFAAQPAPDVAVAEPPEPSPETKAAPVNGVALTVAGSGKVLAARPGQTICEVLEAHGIEFNAECHSGICGSDPIRIVSGREHLDAEPGDQESETLEEICEVEPGQCRLACLARIKGPVTVEILEP